MYLSPADFCRAFFFSTQTIPAKSALTFSGQHLAGGVFFPAESSASGVGPGAENAPFRHAKICREALLPGIFSCVLSCGKWFIVPGLPQIESKTARQIKTAGRFAGQ